MLSLLLHKLIDVIGGAKKMALYRAAALTRDLLFCYLLLLLSVFIQLCGWHRLYLKVGGWWLYPLCALPPIIAFSTQYFHQVFWAGIPLLGLIFTDFFSIPWWVLKGKK